MDQVKLRIARMDDLVNFYDLICDIRVLQNTTKFGHASNQNILNINDYAFMREDDTFEPQILEFESVPTHGADDNFKNFYRRYNSQFILEINNNGDIRYCLCKKNEEEIMQIASRGRQKFKFSFITQTYYIKIKSLTYKLGGENTINPLYSTSVPPSEDGQSYPLQYGETVASLNYFAVELPVNDGDRKMYINNQIIDYEPEPAFGLNTTWDTGFRVFKGEMSPVENMALVVNSFPPLKKIEHQDLDNTGLASINVEEQRDFTKQGYLYILPGESVELVMTNIREGRVQLYEQYSNVR